MPVFKKRDESKTAQKVIDIEAGMEGNLKFSTPINLRISGKFEGELETKGNLSIGENADVKAKAIKGENITIAGEVKGDIVSSERLELSATAKVTGDIKAPILIVNEGAVLKGSCQVPFEPGKSQSKEGPKKARKVLR